MTRANRLIWTEPAGSGDTRLLIVDLRFATGVAVAGLIAAAPLAGVPLGRLGSPFALLVALPPLALALEAFGWRRRLARPIAQVRSRMARLVIAYTAWTLLSATLTLDVAAVAAASVGVAVAGADREERRWQLAGAILGANVGSLLFPFSNLTNLVLVAGSGLAFGAYVSVAIWPQLAAALAVGLLFVVRARRSFDGGVVTAEIAAVESAPGGELEPAETMAGPAGIIAVAGAVGAIVLGLTGGDMAVPFAIASGTLAGLAVATGRLGLGRLARTVPFAGLVVIGVAAAASGPIATAAALLPQPDPTLSGLVLALTVGGLLAMLANNLPAAAFGAVWLTGVHPAIITAFLVGTNVAAIATPHGSVATILARAVGGRHGVTAPVGAYLRAGWRYAATGTLAALCALALTAR